MVAGGPPGSSPGPHTRALGRWLTRTVDTKMLVPEAGRPQDVCVETKARFFCHLFSILNSSALNQCLLHYRTGKEGFTKAKGDRLLRGRRSEGDIVNINRMWRRKNRTCKSQRPVTTAPARIVTMGWGGREGAKAWCPFHLLPRSQRKGRIETLIQAGGEGGSRTEKEQPLPAPPAHSPGGPHRNLPNSPVSPAPSSNHCSPTAGSAQPSQRKAWRSPAEQWL